MNCNCLLISPLGTSTLKNESVKGIGLVGGGGRWVGDGVGLTQGSIKQVHRGGIRKLCNRK